jgi:hypothetical protein
MANGWELAREGIQVIRMDKQLLLFPLLSGIACLLVLASFLLPLWGTGVLEQVLADDGAEAAMNEPLAYVGMFLFYWVNYFVIIFFNSALLACAVIRFRGEEPTLGDGLNAALNRLPQILGWSLVSATVGIILRVIESRSEKAGQIAAALIILGVIWMLVASLVSTALDAIILAGLYLYAAYGTVPQYFDGRMLEDAFKH